MGLYSQPPVPFVPENWAQNTAASLHTGELEELATSTGKSNHLLVETLHFLVSILKNKPTHPPNPTL